MTTKINIIISSDCVWATYVQTICFRKNFTIKYKGDDENKWEVINEAQSCAFSYALDFGSVFVQRMEFDNQLTDSDIFDLLKKQHS